ncbi:MAG: hypothetical protein OSJ72_06485 [Lachnospiraceae bacterium]|nr:hypothetical protein [Lachnospiraceae bacterium]
MANDYMKDYVNSNSGYDMTALLGGGVNGSGSMLSDYASIKNGSYKKMMKAYCAKQEAEKVSVSGDTAQKLTLMKSSADALKKSAEALSDPSLWEKKKFTKKDEETGEETEVEDYDWEAITKAVKSFADDYNTVVEQTGNSDTGSVLQQAVWMTDTTEKTQKLLSKIGLNIGKGNKLELDEEELKKANINTLKSTFSGHGSFADKVSRKAGSISRAASSAAAAAKARATYTKNGKYSDTLSEWMSGAIDKKIGDKSSDKDRTKDTIQQAIDKREKEKAELEKKEQEKKEKEKADRV